MSFGLSVPQTQILSAIFEKYLATGTVLVYGSRAKGTFTQRSDIDLVIQGSQTIDRHLLAEILDAIEDSDFPYLTDIQYFETIQNPQLMEHILRVGKVFYHKEKEQNTCTPL